MDFLRVPDEITLQEIRAKDTSFSPGLYRRVIITTNNVKQVRDLLNSTSPFDKGIEPGSIWYLKHSTHHFIRTKALQKDSYLLYPKGNAITPINPKVFVDRNLCEGDILMAKDSNIGECAMVDGDNWKNHMFSGGIVRLHPICDCYYLYSFLKHPIFKIQLQAMTSRGATITHAKNLWLDCLIPFPNQKDSDKVIHYVSDLMQAIVDKGKYIKKRDDEIFYLITNELESKQKLQHSFNYTLPAINEIKNQGRLDAAIYDETYKKLLHLIMNYEHVFETPKQMGFVVTPGPTLEIKILRTRIDSENYKPNFYALIIPTNISIYGTMSKIPYLGTSKKIPLLKPGDIIFGESGSHRSVVLLDFKGKYITNAHGLYARRDDSNMVKSIFFRCFYDWLYKNGVIDILAVGGSGGHFSPEYFECLKIPKFPEQKQKEIARLYHSPCSPPKDDPTLDTFVDWHRHWNTNLGIWELDREMKNLQRTLNSVQEKIIKGEEIDVSI